MVQLFAGNLFPRNFQVSSAVPEGKGVSSSASVEVASMSAIAAAHGDYTILIL